MIINAFHPDYAKTYAADFIKEMRILSIQKTTGQTMTRFVNKRRKTNPNHGTVHGVSKSGRVSQPPKMMSKK